MKLRLSPLDLHHSFAGVFYTLLVYGIDRGMSLGNEMRSAHFQSESPVQ